MNQVHIQLINEIYILTSIYLKKYICKNSLQEVSKYQKVMDEASVDVDERPRKEYAGVTIERFDDKYYLIASDIFDLTEGHILTDDDLKQLPVKINFTGQPFNFKTDQEKAFELLLRIFSNANKMQDPKFVSFPVG